MTLDPQQKSLLWLQTMLLALARWGRGWLGFLHRSAQILPSIGSGFRAADRAQRLLVVNKQQFGLRFHQWRSQQCRTAVKDREVMLPCPTAQQPGQQPLEEQPQHRAAHLARWQTPNESHGIAGPIAGTLREFSQHYEEVPGSPETRYAVLSRGIPAATALPKCYLRDCVWAAWPGEATRWGEPAESPTDSQQQRAGLPSSRSGCQTTLLLQSVAAVTTSAIGCPCCARTGSPVGQYPCEVHQT